MGRELFLLDLCCGQGGAGMGYHQAGFSVLGVDVIGQPRYPLPFRQGEAMGVLRSILEWGSLDGFRPDVIHSSFPCQRWSLQTRRNGTQDVHPDLIGPGRGLLRRIRSRWGIEWILENVPQAPLHGPALVCGAALGLETDGYHLRRHRHFEASLPHLHGTRCGCRKGMRFLDVTGGGPTSRPRLDRGGGRPHKGTADQVRTIMRMPWATKAGCNEAIPPAYALHVGLQAAAYLRGRQAAA